MFLEWILFLRGQFLYDFLCHGYLLTFYYLFIIICIKVDIFLNIFEIMSFSAKHQTNFRKKDNQQYQYQQFIYLFNFNFFDYL